MSLICLIQMAILYIINYKYRYSMKCILYTCLSVVLFMATGCSDSESESVMVRVKNVSIFNYKDVTVGNEKFGDIASGQCSDYKTCDNAYANEYQHLVVGSDTIEVLVYDHVGEIALKKGKYTYEIDAVKNENDSTVITLSCKAD